MKKSIISSVLVLLMMLVILPCSAYAYQSLNLGNVAAGSAVNYQIASIAPGSSFYCDPGTLPPGCELLTDMSGTVIYFSGTPTTAGQYGFTITVSGSSNDEIFCSLSVTPAAPVIVTSGNVSCYVGEQALLSVSASTGDAGALSYQWYYSSSGSSSGGTPIMGANSPEYYADTSRVGTSYYYCQVTNYSGGQDNVTNSQVISVTVTEAVVQSIMINSMPQKTRYIVGESIDTNGISIIVNYGNGSQQVLSSGFNVYPTILTSAGQVSIELTYGGKTCFFPVTVVSEEDSIQSLSMLQYPYKTDYTQGDALDPTGIIFRAHLTNGTYKDIDSGYTYSPSILNRAGSQTVTITYKNKTCTFSVNVKAKDTEKKLEVTSTPAKLTYNVGDSLNTAGLVLKLTDSGNTQIINSGFTCEPMTLTSAGSQTITVRYNDLTATFTVMVNAVTSPSPSASAEPAVSPTPKVIEHQPHKTSGNGVLVVIMIIALICLIGLGFYMLIMNAGGMEEFKNRVEYRLYKIKSHFRRRK